MSRELAFGGVFFPALILIFIGCALLLWLLDALLGRLGWYRFVWHPPLFRLALFACLFAAGGLLLLVGTSS